MNAKSNKISTQARKRITSHDFKFLIIPKNAWKPNAFIVKTNKNNPLKLFANAKPKTPNKGIKLKEAAKPKKSEIKEILAAFFCSNFA